MGLFGKKDKKITDGYVQPMETIPVATLVSDIPLPTAPLNPTDNTVGGGGWGGNTAGGGGCYKTTNPCSAGSDKNNYARDPTVSRFPMMMESCPHCNQESRTRVTTEPNWRTWTAAGGLFFVFWPICWVPLVVDSCKTSEHFCVKCGSRVARVEAFEDCCVETRG